MSYILQEAKGLLVDGSNERKWTILDVRPTAEFSICSLDGSNSEIIFCRSMHFYSLSLLDVPLPQLLHDPASYLYVC
jgi:hypothetical protein